MSIQVGKRIGRERLDGVELATILAGLKLVQEADTPPPTRDDDDGELLDEDGIDDLCERLNTARKIVIDG